MIYSSRLKAWILFLIIGQAVGLGCKHDDTIVERQVVYEPIQRKLSFRLPRHAEILELRNYLFVTANLQTTAELIGRQDISYVVQLLNSEGKVIVRYPFSEQLRCEISADGFQILLQATPSDLRHCANTSQTIDLRMWSGRAQVLEILWDQEATAEKKQFVQLLFQSPSRSSRRHLIDWHRLSPTDRNKLTSSLPLNTDELSPQEAAALVRSLKRPIAPIGQTRIEFNQISLYSYQQPLHKDNSQMLAYESFEVIGPEDFAVLSVYPDQVELTTQIYTPPGARLSNDAKLIVCVQDLDLDLDSGCLQSFTLPVDNDYSVHSLQLNRGRLIFHASQALIIRASYKISSSHEMNLASQVRKYGVYSLNDGQSMQVQVHPDVDESPIKLIYWPIICENRPRQTSTIKVRFQNSAGESTTVLMHEHDVLPSAYDRVSGRQGYFQLGSPLEWILSPKMKHSAIELSIEGSDGLIWIASRHEPSYLKYEVYSNILVEQPENAPYWHPLATDLHPQVDDWIYTYHSRSKTRDEDLVYLPAELGELAISHPFLVPISHDLAQEPEYNRNYLIKLEHGLVVSFQPESYQQLRLILTNNSSLNELVEIRLGHLVLFEGLIQPGFNEFLLDSPKPKASKLRVRMKARPNVQAFMQGFSAAANQTTYAYRHFYEFNQDALRFKLKKDSNEQMLSLNLAASWEPNQELQVFIDIKFKRKSLDNRGTSFSSWTVSRRHYKVSSSGDEAKILGSVFPRNLGVITLPILLQEDVKNGDIQVQIKLLDSNSEITLVSLSAESPTPLGTLVYSGLF